NKKKLIFNNLRYVKDKQKFKDFFYRVLECQNQNVKLKALKAISSITKMNPATLFSKKWLTELLNNELSNDSFNNPDNKEYMFEIIKTTASITDTYSLHLNLDNEKHLVTLFNILESTKDLKTQAITSKALNNLLNRLEEIFLDIEFFDIEFSMDDISNLLSNSLAQVIPNALRNIRLYYLSSIQCQAGSDKSKQDITVKEVEEKISAVCTLYKIKSNEIFIKNQLNNNFNNIKSNEIFIKNLSKDSFDRNLEQIKSYIDMLITNLADIALNTCFYSGEYSVQILEKMIKKLCPGTLSPKSIATVSELINRTLIRSNTEIKNYDILAFLLESIKKLSTVKEAGCIIDSIKILSDEQQNVEFCKKNKLADTLLKLEALPLSHKKMKIDHNIQLLLVKLLTQEERKELKINIKQHSSYESIENKEEIEKRVLDIKKYTYLIQGDQKLLNSIYSADTLKTIVTNAVESKNTDLKIACMNLLSILLKYIDTKHNPDNFRLFTNLQLADKLITTCNSKRPQKEITNALMLMIFYMDTDSDIVSFHKQRFISTDELLNLTDKILSLDYHPVDAREQNRFGILINQIIVKSLSGKNHELMTRFYEQKWIDLMYRLFFTAFTQSQMAQVSIILSNIVKHPTNFLTRFKARHDINQVVVKVVRAAKNIRQEYYSRYLSELIYAFTCKNLNGSFNTKETVDMFFNLNKHKSVENFYYESSMILQSIENILKGNNKGQEVFFKNNIFELVFKICTDTKRFTLCNIVELNEILTKYKILDSAFNILQMPSENSVLLKIAWSKKSIEKFIETVSTFSTVELKMEYQLKFSSYLLHVIENHGFRQYIAEDESIYHWLIRLVLKNTSNPKKILPVFKVIAELTTQKKETEIIPFPVHTQLVNDMVFTIDKAYSKLRGNVKNELTEAFLKSLSNLINFSIISANSISREIAPLIKKICENKEFRINNYIECIVKIMGNSKVVDKNTIYILLDLGAKADIPNQVELVANSINTHITNQNNISFFQKKTIKKTVIHMSRCRNLNKHTRVVIFNILINSLRYNSLKGAFNSSNLNQIMSNCLLSDKERLSHNELSKFYNTINSIKSLSNNHKKVILDFLLKLSVSNNNDVQK
ncbi:MAG: hypothetical protein GY730_00270, partial [bacterium]|nr:hypothetical protein [bacterium]